MHTCIRVFAFAPLSSQTNVPQQILRAIETSTLRKREEVSAQTEEHPIGYARMEKYKKKKYKEKTATGQVCLASP